MHSSNQKIVLINPCGWQRESVNLGLSYLAACLLQKGFEVLILDLNRYELDDTTLLERVRQYEPFLVGISVKTATAEEGGRLAILLAGILSNTVLVVGGPHVTLCAEMYLQENPAFSFGIMGEGEESFVALARALQEGHPASEVKGIVWRRGKNLVVNEWSPPQDLNSLPFPNLDVIEGFSWEKFRYPILTSRGCPFKCTYCCVNKLTGSYKWRYRSTNNVIDELEHLVRTKALTTFEVWDDNFTLDIRRAKAICRELIKRKLNLSWYCHNGIRADRIDLELAQLMKEAGCTSIAFGMETGNPEVFDSIKKGEPLSAVVNAVKIVKKAGIQAVGYFIIGLPGDNLETFVETVRFQRKLKLDHYVFGMLIPYPKTEVWDIVQKKGEILCGITQTQHFHSDIVPVSFELPEFPKRDMVRAFYIATYIDLFEAIDRLVNKSCLPHVYYHGADQYLNHIAGMVIACHEGTHHTVVSDLSSKQLVRQRGFTQLSKGTSLAVVKSLPETLLRQDTVHVCIGSNIPHELLLGNANIVLINPQHPLHRTVQVRRYIPGAPLPQILLGTVGTVLSFSDVVRYFGLRKIGKVVRRQFVGLCLRVVNRIWTQKPETTGWRRHLVGALRFAALLFFVGPFIKIKYRLGQLKHKKKAYSFDDYSSYL